MGGRRRRTWIAGTALLAGALGVVVLLLARVTLRDGEVLSPASAPGLIPDALGVEAREEMEAGAGETRLRAAPYGPRQSPTTLVWRVAGRVTDVAGSPVAGADVVLAESAPPPEDHAEVRTRTRTGADGTYRLTLGEEGRRAGTLLVSATAPDLGALSHCPSLSALPIDPTGSVLADLVLYPVGRLTGRVLAAGGLPVPGATVEVWARWPEGGTGRRSFPCDVEGRYAVGGLFGTISCRAAASGHGDHDHLLSIPVGGALRKDLTLVARSAGIRLRLLAPTGQPVAGLKVAAGTFHDLESGSGVLGTTDAEGRVTLVGFLPSDQVRVRVPVRDGGELWCCDPGVEELAVGDPPELPEVTIPLRPGALVRGVVRASSGEPVGPGYPVAILAGGARQEAVTDAAGRVVFEEILPVGAAHLDAAAMPDGLDVEVTPGVCELDLVVDPCVRVEVRLVRPDGAPLRGRWPRSAAGGGLSLRLEAEPGAPSAAYPIDLEGSGDGALGAWAPSASLRSSRVVLRSSVPPSHPLVSSDPIGPVRTGSTVSVDLRVPPDLLPSVRGRLHVRGASTPCFSAYLMLTSLDAPRPSGARHAFFFGTDRFELPFVRPGRYELLLSESSASARRTLVVPETGVLDLGDVELEPR